ncbi:low molecular weight protein-tyrosine-phosphatase [Pseudalkalibacillus caeni]|uniref:protein-tyrosine-phosphatase n=1 Tax=Exobacillus caeni TaxID=2574798 RepID=A0A5R9EWV9_9BACL|nr:low molecular weight protein-tyrosine-phosphatase [Pseudalkalibacillus caeni]TLS35742.1 low molecular weight phosphotyrosine protein phosphatase [Pseudalkalibacillus caeni]
MVNVLFVCLGNICRSPMAEAIFRDLIKENGMEGKIAVDSAGTGDWHIGAPPHEGTQNILSNNNIDYENIKARQIVKEDIDTFEYIIAMDAKNLGEINRLAGKKPKRLIARLLDFVPESKVEDVPDPYFTGNFEEVYEMVSEACLNLFNMIKEREEL